MSREIKLSKEKIEDIVSQIKMQDCTRDTVLNGLIGLRDILDLKIKAYDQLEGYDAMTTEVLTNAIMLRSCVTEIYKDVLELDDERLQLIKYDILGIT